VSARFIQIPESLRSASLRPIAVLNLQPGDFAERYGLTFVPDARGTSVAALLETRPGQQYMLLRHHDDPGAGVEVLARESGPSEPDLREFLAAFDLDQRVVSWTLAEGNGASSASENHVPMTLGVGESLVGEGNEVAHVDLLIGLKDGPVGKAFAAALINQQEGHTSLLAVVAPNLPAKPDTLMSNKVTIKGATQAVQMFGPAQAAVARAVVDSVRDGVIPQEQVDDLCLVVCVFIHAEATDDKKIFDWNYQATKEAIARGLKGEPSVHEVIDGEAEARHSLAGRAHA
jgi:5,6,7,8-tetrahydromethanopterin hydro-lyase